MILHNLSDALSLLCYLNKFSICTHTFASVILHLCALPLKQFSESNAYDYHKLAKFRVNNNRFLNFRVLKSSQICQSVNITRLYFNTLY